MEQINADTFASDLRDGLCEDNEPAVFIIHFTTQFLSRSETTDCESITAKTEKELKAMFAESVANKHKSLPYGTRLLHAVAKQNGKTICEIEPEWNWIEHGKPIFKLMRKPFFIDVNKYKNGLLEKLEKEKSELAIVQ